MLGFKSFWSARIIIAGIETMHMIRKFIRKRTPGPSSVPNNPGIETSASTIRKP